MLSGGNYSLAGGFWGLISVVHTPGAPLLNVARNPVTGVVTVSWPKPADGWVLDQTGALAASPATTLWSQVGFPYTTNATQTVSRVISFFPPHQHDEIRHLLSTALQAIVSLRLVPRKDGRGRVPAAEVLINTAAVADNIRDLSKQLNIPDLISEGSVQYGMQSFDQSLFHWYTQGVISYESAIFYATNPSEFALKVSGVDSSGNRLGGADAAGAIELTP